MHFPLLRDIATTEIICIEINNSVSEALEKMLKSGHRDIIVNDGDKFFVLTAIDVLAIHIHENNRLDTALSNFDLEPVPTLNKETNILETLFYIQQGVEYLIVTDENNKLYGLITNSDIISHIDPETLMENYRLSDFLKVGKRMKWVSTDEKTSTILYDMSENKFDNVIIVEDKKPIGILTTKDIMTLIQNDSDLSKTVVHYMSSPVETIYNTSSIKDALKLIKSSHYKRIIVVQEDDELVGTVSQKELISLTYSKWAELMKQYQDELFEINKMLEKKSEKYQKLASSDSLTGLYTRYKFSELYITSYKTMLQRQNSLSIIMLDIDHFKKINDTYGHNTGDAVLIQTAHVLLRTLRGIDIICRWGGEEFVILLPTASSKTALELAEKLRINISQNEIEVVGCIQASFGVTEVAKGDSMEEAIGRADKALYAAKTGGRNCVKLQLID